MLPTLGIAVPSAAGLAWAGLVFAEGCWRFLCEGLLGPLLQHGKIRASLVLRQALFLCSLGLLVVLGEVGLSTVLAAELAASLLAALVALAGLTKHVRALPAPSARVGWKAPAPRELWRVALPMYGGHLLTLAYGPQVFLLLLQRFAGVETAAVFGFLHSLYAQAARYLPATLLFSLVRPKLVASYVGGGGMAELSRNANLAGKLSLFVLMPVVSFSVAGGEALISLLSGGNFARTGLLFFAFMLALVPFSQRQLLETVAVTAGRARLCILGAAVGLFTLPIMFWLLYSGAGPWAGVAALGAGHLLFALVVISGLSGGGYRPDHAGLARLGMAAAAGAIAAGLVPRTASLWLDLLVLGAGAGLTFLVVAWLLSPFAPAERQSMNYLLGRELFHV
ncbi:MAG: hypothetical protein M5U08_02355 [Burkholderiales bacterium]|nr:hypothetical protein [Burkholderiales bacterium]